MRTRVDAGTDVAMVGAWDVDRGATPFSAEEQRQLTRSLDADAERGLLVVRRTGADGGGPIDVYVDEPIADDVVSSLTPEDDEYTLEVPSGRVVIDGVEHYRANRPDSSQAIRTIVVSPGTYAVRWYASAKGDEQASPSDKSLEDVVGADELRYYERVTRSGCLVGIALLALFPTLAPFAGWRVAFVVTVVLVVGFFQLREYRLRRNERFIRLREAIAAFRFGSASPTLVLTLRRLPDGAA